MTPYYEEEGITIYHGDCRDILPKIPSVDFVLTDPPYGLEFEYASYADTREQWFALMHDIIPTLKTIAPFAVLPCCGPDRLEWWYANYPPTWPIIWYKGSPGHRSFIGFNDWELLLAYGKPPKQMHDYFQTPCGFDNNGHPCPKPIEWAKWLIEKGATEGATVLDPFMGSGTTLRAAKDLGRKAIGIELDQRYCDIAVERLAQEVLAL